ncbi:MAG: hypothetical protein EOO20_02265 [Chryseobacterium sp.]|nr:MAG: hypothetical protein EOO20_02265 [Chryseobacterium sp.]
MSISAKEETAKAAEKSIRFSLAVHDKLQKLSAKLGRPQTLVFAQMVDYFHRTKKDPIDLNDEMLKSSILKNAQNQMGFLKTQEKIFLLPMNEKIGEVSQHQEEILEAFDEQVLQANRVRVDEHKQQMKYLVELHRLINDFNGQIRTKMELKENFLYILNNYISSREKVNGLFNPKEREQLVAETIKRVNNL